ncbi:MAG TPA: NYN domain-containing protein [Puia sp.]|nr:NYN domain-containing protein [Puia sp.]
MEPIAIKQRVITYIDGFNLYFGMCEGGRKDTLWLNIQLLAQSLLKPDQELVFTKYFTSRVKNDPPKVKRQNTYIEAIETLDDCHVYYGSYLSYVEECRKCGHSYLYASEKMTDVNIAVEMLGDAYLDRYDMALLITGDSDLIPPIKAIHNLFKNKRVFVAFPPNRHNIDIQYASKGSIVIGRKKLKDAQFPDNVAKKDGFILRRPAEWS